MLFPRKLACRPNEDGGNPRTNASVAIFPGLDVEVAAFARLIFHRRNTPFARLAAPRRLYGLYKDSRRGGTLKKPAIFARGLAWAEFRRHGRIAGAGRCN